MGQSSPFFRGIVLRRNIVNIDMGGTGVGYHRRYLSNSLAILLSDAVAVWLSLLLGNLFLWWINGIEVSIQKGFLIIPAWLFVAGVSRLVPGWGLGVVDELRRIQRALFVMFAAVLVVSFLSKQTLPSSRIVFLFTYLFCAVLIPLGRSLCRGVLAHFGRWGIPVSIYGDSESLGLLIDALRAEPGLGYIPSVVFSEELAQGSVFKGISVLGNLRNTTHRTSVAIVALTSVSRHRLIEILEGPMETYRRVIIVPDLKEAPSLWVVPRDLQGILGLEITQNLLNPVARGFKRAIDFALVFGALPLWLPIMTVLCIAIWLEDRGNPIFLQSRLGRGGKVFRTVKFRTMVPNAERVLKRALKRDPALRAEWETHFKLKKDPRITKVGWFLRRTSLDELPQLFNVMAGTMSLVGPRPLPEYHFRDLPERVQFLRDKVYPGITGLWQVSGRSESGTAGMEKWDPYYVRNWSIWLDIVILFRTFKAVLFARGAY